MMEDRIQFWINKYNEAEFEIKRLSNLVHNKQDEINDIGSRLSATEAELKRLKEERDVFLAEVRDIDSILAKQPILLNKTITYETK